MPRVIPQSLVLSSLLPSLPHPTCSKLHAATGTTLNLTTPLYDRFPEEGTEAREGEWLAQGPAVGPVGNWAYTLDHRFLLEPSPSSRVWPPLPPGLFNKQPEPRPGAVRSEMNREGLPQLTPTPGESHFPQSHASSSTFDRFLSVLASHFSDRSSRASQMPPPGWPPGILQVKAPEANSAASSQTAPLPPFPFSRRARHLQRPEPVA